MARSYRHISMYENEIIRLREEGFTGREICEKLGFSEKQYRNFITRYNTKQRKLEKEFDKSINYALLIR